MKGIRILIRRFQQTFRYPESAWSHMPTWYRMGEIRNWIVIRR